jgi:hypothetical protein
MLGAALQSSAFAKSQNVLSFGNTGHVFGADEEDDLPQNKGGA